MAQTPQQRRANDRYAKQETSKRGKPESVAKQSQKKTKPTISPLWIGDGLWRETAEDRQRTGKADEKQRIGSEEAEEGHAEQWKRPQEEEENDEDG